MSDPRCLSAYTLHRKMSVSELLLKLFFLLLFHSGPLFSFDVHDDIRLVNDATVEKDEVSASVASLYPLSGDDKKSQQTFGRTLERYDGKSLCALFSVEGPELRYWTIS